MPQIEIILWTFNQTYKNKFLSFDGYLENHEINISQILAFLPITVQHETLGGFGTARKLAEIILATDHTNNSSLFELTTFGG